MVGIRIVALDFDRFVLPGFRGIIDFKPNVHTGQDDEQHQQKNQIHS
jgi:hypothetical protein